MRKPRRQGEKAIEKHLGEALSAEERDAVRARLLLGLDPGERARLLGELPADTSGALATALSARKGEAAAPGVRKLRSIWERFLSRWAEIILDTGDEKGPYISQDPHWDPPWLDGSGVTRT